MDVYPESYYKGPESGVEELERESNRQARIKERKAYRAVAGCAGCQHKGVQVFGLFICKEGKEPHSGGFCGSWWDQRARPKTP